MLKSSVYISLILLVTAITASSQSKYTVEDGLASDHVYRVMEDKEGFVWIATNAGVCKFDGYGFDCFTVKDGLPDNDVFNIMLDDQDRIWLSAVSSAAAYIRDDVVHNVHSYEGRGISKGIVLDSTDVVIYSKTSKLYIDTDDSITLVNFTSRHSKQLTLENDKTLIFEKQNIKLIQNDDTLVYNVENHPVHTFASADVFWNNRLLLRHKDGHGLFYLNVKSGKSETIRFEHDGKSKYPASLVIQRPSLEKDQFQVYNANRLYYISLEGEITDTIELPLLDEGYINCAMTDSKGNQWLSTSRGLFLYKKKFANWTYRNSIGRRR